MEIALQNCIPLDRIDINVQKPSDSLSFYHYERVRLNKLFTEAVRYPLILVCAGTGYGKTSAAHDFTAEYQTATTWIQLSEHDNRRERFWENFVHSMVQGNYPNAGIINKIGFPDTSEKMNHYRAIMNNYFNLEERIIVIDDFQFLKDLTVIRFIEECILFKMPPGTSVILISRSTPRFNTAGLISKGLLFNISENELRFTESELAHYFHRLDIFIQPDSQREIMQDTGGWALAINLIARSYRNAPGYLGYLRSAMKINIFRLMETEIWEGIPIRLQFFLVELSLIGHLSFDLIKLLAGGDDDLVMELEQQNAYIRRDSHINAYLIHPLFLEFLSTKQDLLSPEQKRRTYIIAGDWCSKNGFKIDAISYYEKIRDYESIVSIICALEAQIPYDIAKYAAAIFDRSPENEFETVEFLAVMHLRSYMSQGLWKKSNELTAFYEAQFAAMPKKDLFRNRNLSALYLCWGNLRSYMCITDNRYDFDAFFKKFNKRLFLPEELDKLAIRSLGPWVNAVGTSSDGSLDEYIYILSRAVSLMSSCRGYMAGEDDLARGELMFFKYDLRVAEHYITRALGQAREHGQFEITHRALLYTLRISIAQGNYAKAEQAVKDEKALFEENPYSTINHDIFLSWYYIMLGIPEQIPEWLKQNFSPYGHEGFKESFQNQVKARFCYITRSYPPLLAYIHETLQRESYLFGRVEMLAMKACVYYRMKDKRKAFNTLLEAYKTASPNDLVMPFIELGKDMRTLTSSAMKEPGSLESVNIIPRPWLLNINRKAASYAKRQANVIYKYREANRITDSITFSPRESEVLTDLSHGLSRAEIASSRSLSINTVKMVINMIYNKVGAENLADLIRIAVERKMI